MKLLKLSILAVLMTFAMMSCTDKSTEPDYIGWDYDVFRPNSTLLIKTYIDGVEIESKSMRIENGVCTPSNYIFGGAYNDSIPILRIALELNNSTPISNYKFEFNTVLKKLEPGTYSYTLDDSKKIKTIYLNKDIYENPLIGDSTMLEIKNVEYIGNERFGAYYISGSLEMEMFEFYPDIPKVIVKAEFQNIPLLTVKY